MNEIKHEIKINATPEKTFKALYDLNALKAWHTAHIEGQDSVHEVLTFKGSEKPTFIWKISQSEPNKKVAWECLDGPGDSAGTKAIYELSTTDDNRTLVKLNHTSWPDQEGNFKKCNTLWGILLYHLKNYVETGKTNPAIL